MKTHQMSKTRIYRIWAGMRNRCQNKNNYEFHNYGGRGITVCDEWERFEKFYADMKEGYKDILSIDRIDNNSNYEKSNCRWATDKEQHDNQRMKKLDRDKIKEIRKKAKIKTGRELAKEYGVCSAVISEIINKRRNYGNY